MKFPKPARQTDERYLNFVRKADCCVVGCNHVFAEPHHLRTRGAGGGDYTAIPLCRVHHSELHHIGPARFEKEHALSLGAVNAACLSAYLSEVYNGV